MSQRDNSCQPGRQSQDYSLDTRERWEVLGRPTAFNHRSLGQRPRISICGGLQAEGLLHPLESPFHVRQAFSLLLLLPPEPGALPQATVSKGLWPSFQADARRGGVFRQQWEDAWAVPHEASRQDAPVGHPNPGLRPGLI